MCVGLDGPDKTAILLGEIVTNFGLLPVGEVIRLLRGGGNRNWDQEHTCWEPHNNS